MTTDLTALTGVKAVSGLPSVQVTGTAGTVAYRTASGAIEVLTLTWETGQPVPVYNQDARTVNFSSAGVTTTTTPLATTAATIADTPKASATTTTTTTKPPTKATTTTDQTIDNNNDHYDDYAAADDHHHCSPHRGHGLR